MYSRISLDHAVSVLTDHVNSVNETIRIDTYDAPGYILAEDIVAPVSHPPFPRSALDGYAVRAGDIADASKEHPKELRVIDKIMAGHTSHAVVTRDTAVRIMTGAPVPEGADYIVRQENTDYGEDRVRIMETPGRKNNIDPAGEDFKAGTVLARSGERLDAALTGIAAAAGKAEVSVYRRPRVAIFSSGDELAEPGEALPEGKIYDSNLHMLYAYMKERGVEVVRRAFIADDPALMAEMIRNVADQVDVIFTTGGVSVGQKDIMHDTGRELGAERLFWGVDLKPGAPTLALLYKEKIILCLSGNPFGAYVNLLLLGSPVLARIARDESLALHSSRACAACDFHKPAGARRIVRAKYENGAFTIPDTGNTPGNLSTLKGCNCLVDIPADRSGVRAGEEMHIWLTGEKL